MNFHALAARASRAAMYVIAAIISDSETAKSLEYPAQLRMRSAPVPTSLIVL